MNIILLNPPTRDDKKFIREGRCTQEQGVWATLWPPLSLATIGAVFEEDGHSVKIFDCAGQNMSWDDVEQLVAGAPPDVVMWSTGTPSIKNDLELAQVVKECSNSIVTAVFGTHVSVLDKECMNAFPALDFIVRNEPEETSRELVKALQHGAKIEEVRGITFRNSEGIVVRNQDRPFIENLDALPFPAWHLVDLDCYRLPLKGKKFLMISPLRGCPFNCSFCTCRTYYGRKIRKRSVESVLKEIEYDIRRFGVQDIFFWAETFVIDKEFVRALCNAILERDFKIAWTANSRVDTVDPSLLKLMAKAGCWMISYGIESGSQDVLDAVGKGTRVEQATLAVRDAKDAGIKTVGHFILGLPGDTEKSLDQTIEFAKHLEIDLAQFYCAVPFPGSKLYEDALQKGWIAQTAFSNFKQDYALMELPELPSGTVNRYRKRAYREFYMNLRRGCRTLMLVNWKDIKKLLSAVKDFAGWLGR